MLTQAPKGTKDWYGKEMLLRRKVEAMARELCNNYNINEIATPVFEHTELFLRGVGETTDVVQKEMYTFDDKGGRSITLKPEGTASAVRAFLQNTMYADIQPTKLFYFTPAFRYENPQAGRFRQHHQFGIEFFGSHEPQAEIELITLLTEFIDQLGLKETKLHLNSIGCPECRKEYNKVLMAYFDQNKDKFCTTCKDRMNKNPLRVLDCKDPNCSELVKGAPKTIDYLDEECKTHFEKLKSLLSSLNIDYVINPNIVRGLDYYTKTVFEFVDKDGFTLCGGGRYDKLVGEIGKNDIPAVGFGIGIERILLFLQNEGIDLNVEKPVDIYVGVLGDNVVDKSYEIVKMLRNNNIKTETDFLGRSVKAQMKYANKLGALFTVIIGENEINENKVTVKEMATGEQTELTIEALIDFMKKQKENIQ
ncbi:histidyl-tRNA synthetase [Natranaerovirga hydrolytica]|uniref:Histidine--tRNA ligase n=1 Tax=Natranaerovirga hydrolytica TaxID=680378 RepID=A0A4R1N5C0_9FIRM|nr:histidine--tRNA ligase [Natranaerovirga hydrolytica]TCK97803.1 histidyl-tRNA synthetase [Natranaerovirga hydrolytica]